LKRGKVVEGEDEDVVVMVRYFGASGTDKGLAS
jgi:hypothetical protein